MAVRGFWTAQHYRHFSIWVSGYITFFNGIFFYSWSCSSSKWGFHITDHDRLQNIENLEPSGGGEIVKCLPQLISSTFCRNRIVEACLVYVRVERGRWSSSADPELPGCAIITSANCKKSPAGSKLFLTNRWERNCLRWTSSLINSARDIMSAGTRFTYQEPAVRNCHQLIWWWRIDAL